MFKYVKIEFHYCFKKENVEVKSTKSSFLLK